MLPDLIVMNGFDDGAIEPVRFAGRLTHLFCKFPKSVPGLLCGFCGSFRILQKSFKQSKRRRASRARAVIDRAYMERRPI